MATSSPEGSPLPVEGPPPVTGNARTPPRFSLAESLSRLLGQLLNEDIVIRSLAALVAVAVWSTLVYETLHVTRQISGLVNNQDPFVQAYPTQTTTSSSTSSYALTPASPPFSGLPAYPQFMQLPQPPPVYYAPPPSAPPAYIAPGLVSQVVMTIMTLVVVVAAVPVLLMWLALLRLTRHALRVFAESVLEWPIRRDQVPPVLGGTTARGETSGVDDQTGLVSQFLRWFTALALCYLAILGVYVVGRGMMTASILVAHMSQSQHTVPKAPSPVAGVRIKPVDRDDIIHDLRKEFRNLPVENSWRDDRRALRESARSAYAEVIGIKESELNDPEARDIEAVIGTIIINEDVIDTIINENGVAPKTSNTPNPSESPTIPHYPTATAPDAP